MTLRKPADVPLRLFGHIRMKHGSVRIEWDKQLKFCNYTNLAARSLWENSNKYHGPRFPLQKVRIFALELAIIRA